MAPSKWTRLTPRAAFLAGARSGFKHYKVSPLYRPLSSKDPSSITEGALCGTWGGGVRIRTVRADRTNERTAPWSYATSRSASVLRRILARGPAENRITRL